MNHNFLTCFFPYKYACLQRTIHKNDDPIPRSANLMVKNVHSQILMTSYVNLLLNNNAILWLPQVWTVATASLGGLFSGLVGGGVILQLLHLQVPSLQQPQSRIQDRQELEEQWNVGFWKVENRLQDLHSEVCDILQSNNDT